MFWNVFLLEKDKLFKRGMFWIELAILASLIVVIDLGLYLISLGLSHRAAVGLSNGFTWPFGLVSAVLFAGAHAIGGLLLIILIGTMTAQEYSWRTVHMWLCHGVSRPMLIGAKFVASLLAILVVLLTSLIVGGGITGYLTYALHGTLNIGHLDSKQFILFFLETGYSLLPYIALTSMLAVISRSVGVTIGGSLAFVFLMEGILYPVLTSFGGSVAQAVQYLPIGLTNALLFQGSNSSFPLMPSSVVALAGIALYTLVFCGITLWVFQRQNFTN